MEIKRSPDVVRPVEVAKKAPRWPWVIGIILGALILLAVGVVAYVMYSQRLQPAQKNNANNAANATNAANTTKPASLRTINEAPTPADLSKVVFGQYKSPVADSNDKFSGPLSLGTLDLSRSSATVQNLTTLERKEASTSVHGVVSPNGQFLAIFEPAGNRTSANDAGKTHVWLVDLGNGKAEEIATGVAFVGQLVWSDDSASLIWGSYSDGSANSNSANAKSANPTAKLTSYDLATGKARDFDRPSEAKDGLAVEAQAFRKGDLYVVMQPIGSNQTGTLSVIKTGKDGALDADAEKLLDLSEGVRGVDISSDGTQVVTTSGSGTGTAAANTPPYVIELFDRTSADSNKLRTSQSEQYADPLFTPDGKDVVYTAASGIWMYNLKSGDRTQLIASDEIDSLLPSGDVKLLSVQPDGSNLIFGVSTVRQSSVFALSLSSKEATANDAVELSKGDVLGQSVFGWTN